MIRAAAKNYQDVAVIVDPEDYDKVLEELKAGGVSLETKKYLQYKVFAHTAVYDSLISNYLARSSASLSPTRLLSLTKRRRICAMAKTPSSKLFSITNSLSAKALFQARSSFGARSFPITM